MAETIYPLLSMFSWAISKKHLLHILGISLFVHRKKIHLYICNRVKYLFIHKLHTARIDGVPFWIPLEFETMVSTEESHS